MLSIVCLDEECFGALPPSLSCISVIHTRHISSAFSQVLNDRLKCGTSGRKKSLLSFVVHNEEVSEQRQVFLRRFLAYYVAGWSTAIFEKIWKLGPKLRRNFFERNVKSMLYCNNKLCMNSRKIIT